MKKRDGFNIKMKTIAKIGGVDEDNKIKRRGARKNNKGDESDDTFGVNEGDWQLYKDISKHGFEEGEEEQDQQALEDINEQIAELNPNFTWLFNDDQKQQLTEEDFQLRLVTDRFRGAEIMFQPSIIGCENAGLTEVLENLFSLYSKDQASILTNFVLLTGGNTKIENLDRRIESEIRMLREPNSNINIVKSYDPDLDAWRGAVLYAKRDDYIEQTSITKEQYEEWGPHYFKEHFASNTRYGEASSVNPTIMTPRKRQKIEE